MIINIRGTSGSGKSTLARRIIAMYTGHKQGLGQEGRKQPVGYMLTHPTAQPLVVIGHYESPCGGCDTIKTYDQVFRMVRDSHNKGYNVLFEGLLLSTDRNHIAELMQEHKDHLIVGLNVPIEECLRCVNERRRAKNPEREDVNPKGTISKHGTNQRIMARLMDLGLNAEWHDRESAFTRICKELGI